MSTAPSVPMETQLQIVKQFVKRKDMQYAYSGDFDRDDLEGKILEELTRWPPKYPGEVMRRCQFAFADWVKKRMGGTGKGEKPNKPTRHNVEHTTLEYQLTPTMSVAEVVMGEEDVIRWGDDLSEVTKHFRPRDRVILELLSEGYTFEEIGAALGVSKASVSRYVARMRPKLAEVLGLT